MLPSMVSTPLLKRRIIDDEFAVKEYQISSLLSRPAQDGLKADCVAPVVLAAIEEAQVVPNGWVVIAIALTHSSFAGGAGTC